MSRFSLRYLCIFVLLLSFLSFENILAAPAFDFTLDTVGGKTVSLKEAKGKGVILFFFTTWCLYCRQKFPSLSKDYETFRREGFELFAIDAGESQAKVSSFLSKVNPPFDVLLDKSTAVSEAYGIVGVPTFILISKSGVIVYEGNDLPRGYKDLLNK
ncbi:MAG: TlpA disulfide reductase family protein [Candidatus Omnitrophota bacterium]